MNKNRRKFLKMILIGGSSFIVGKTLGPLFSMFSSGETMSKDGRITFKVTDDNKGLLIKDDTGEEVFHIDNEV